MSAFLLVAAGCDVLDPANADARNADVRNADARDVAARKAEQNRARGLQPTDAPQPPVPTGAPTEAPPNEAPREQPGTAGPADTAWIEVLPGTATAGSSVTLEADCGDGSTTARATSDAFSPVALTSDGTVLRGEGLVARRTLEGTYRVLLICPSGATATTSLDVVKPGRSTMGPHTGGGFLARNGATSDAATATDGSRRGTWLAGGLAAFAASAALAAHTIRRRRRSTATGDASERAAGTPGR